MSIEKRTILEGQNFESKINLEIEKEKNTFLVPKFDPKLWV